MRDVYKLLGALLDAANEHADTLSQLIEESAGDDNRQAHESYAEQLANLESAIQESREILRPRMHVVGDKISRFAIGQQFKARGKGGRISTVTDILFTHNAADELVRIRYVATHQLMGQAVTDSDVCETTIAMGAV